MASRGKSFRKTTSQNPHTGFLFPHKRPAVSTLSLWRAFRTSLDARNSPKARPSSRSGAKRRLRRLAWSMASGRRKSWKGVCFGFPSGSTASPDLITRSRMRKLACQRTSLPITSTTSFRLREQGRTSSVMFPICTAKALRTAPRIGFRSAGSLGRPWGYRSTLLSVPRATSMQRRTCARARTTSWRSRCKVFLLPHFWLV